jgi:hypothetical protein
MKTRLLLAAFCLATVASAQSRFGLSTGLSLLRNLSPSQTFWTIGQTVSANLHFAPQQTAYASLDYYQERGFINNFTATAKLPATLPQTIPFNATGRLRYRQLSVGLKHYFRGAYDSRSVSIYGLTGFGFLFARATNAVSVAVDTSAYYSPVIAGQGGIKRLTFDLGLGAEVHAGSFLYLVGSVRAWLPSSYHSSPLLHNSDRVPLSLMASAGVRFLFGAGY